MGFFVHAREQEGLREFVWVFTRSWFSYDEMLRLIKMKLFEIIKCSKLDTVFAVSPLKTIPAVTSFPSILYLTVTTGRIRSSDAYVN